MAGTQGGSKTPNGFDIELGDLTDDGIGLFIDSGVGGDPATAFYRPHYELDYNSLLANRTDITGKPGRQNINQSILFWAYEDWTGGEGQKFYDSTKPTKFWTSEPAGTGSANTRVAGYFTGNPPPTTSSIATYTVGAAPTFSAAADGYLWVAALQKAWASTDTTSWTEYATGISGANIAISGMASDGRRIYVAQVNYTSGATIITRMDTAGNAAFTASATYLSTVSPGLGKSRTPLAFIPNNTSPFLYLWTGTELYSHDTTAGLTVTATKVFATGKDVSPTALMYSDMVVSDTSVIFMASVAGRTRVYHYAPTGTTSGAPVWAGAPLWTLPEGFTGYSMCYQNGQLYVLGRTDSRAALWGFDYAGTKTPYFVNFLEPQFTQLPAWDGDDGQWEIGNGVGTQILLNAPTMLIFDAAQNAYSAWFTPGNTGTFAASATQSLGAFEGARYVAGPDTTVVKITTFGSDFDATTVAGTIQTSAWDFDLPEQEKRLLGIHVLTSALGTPTVTIGYQVDESGSYTDFTTLNSGTANFIDAPTGANTVTFRQLRLRIATTGGAKVYSVTARCDIPDFQKEYTYSIRVKDEKYNQGNSRMRGWTADKILDALLDLKEGKQILAVKDAFRKRRPGTQGSGNVGYVSYNAVIDDVNVVEPYNAQGTVRITLRDVTP